MTNTKTAPSYKIQGVLGMNLHLAQIGPEGSKVTFEPASSASRVALDVTDEDSEYVSISGTVKAVSGGVTIPFKFLSDNEGRKINVLVRDMPGEVEQVVLNVVK